MKIAVIGCGQITQRIYGPILSSLKEELQVVAICDLDGARASHLSEARFPNAGVFRDVSSLLEEVQLDGALVLTSELANADAAKQIIRQGDIGVYLEKPPASSEAELVDLIEAEAKSNSYIYTAFNRRHTPLFKNLKIPPAGLRRVSGLLSRKNREVATFPFTCVHLLDSAQFFAQSPVATTKINFEQEETFFWKITGEYETGASYELTFIPDGERESEYLIFEAPDRNWKLHFPESDGTTPVVRLISEHADHQKEETSHSVDDPCEIMGFAPCFKHFLHHLQRGTLAHSGHRLNSCARTIGILEAMQKAHAELLSV